MRLPAFCETGSTRTGASVLPTFNTFIIDPEVPLSGQVFYYLNRPLVPNAGNWGQDSELLERMVPCASP